MQSQTQITIRFANSFSKYSTSRLQSWHLWCYITICAYRPIVILFPWDHDVYTNHIIVQSAHNMSVSMHFIKIIIPSMDIHKKRLQMATFVPTYTLGFVGIHQVSTIMIYVIITLFLCKLVVCILSQWEWIHVLGTNIWRLEKMSLWLMEPALYQVDNPCT